MNNIFQILISLLFSSISIAQTQTQYYGTYFYRPQLGISSIVLSYENDQQAQTLVNLTSENNFKETISDMHLKYDYGFSEELSFGFQLTYGTYSYESNNKNSSVSGLGDFKFNLDGITNEFYYGIILGLSKGSQNRNATGQLTNRNSGGSSFELYTGRFWHGIKFNPGFRISHFAPLPQKNDYSAPLQNQTGTMEGGGITRLTLLAERDSGQFNFTASLSYNKIANRIYKYSDTSKDNETYIGSSFFSLGFLTNYSITNEQHLFCGMQIEDHPNSDFMENSTETYKAYTGTNLFVGFQTEI